MKKSSFFFIAVFLLLQSCGAVSNDSLFGELCKVVEDNFFDSNFNGVNWTDLKKNYAAKLEAGPLAAPFASVVNEMLSKLKASHTHYYTRDNQEYYHLSDIFVSAPFFKPSICKVFSNCTVSYTGVGIFTETVGNDIFVSNVLDSLPAFNAGILPGDRIVSVDGKPYEPVASFRGKAGMNVTIKIQRTADTASIRSVSVKPILLSPNDMFTDAMKKSARILPNKGRRIGYVHVWSFAGERYYALLKELLTSTLADADVLVLDIRDGYGGANPDYLNVFNPRVPILKQKLRNGPAWTYDPQWRKPVVLLINEGSRSGKEIIAFSFRKYGYGKIVGTKTAGAFLAARPFYLSDGSLLYLAGGTCLVDGENLEGIGVAPDFPIEQQLKYRAGKDLQLEKAVIVATEVVK
jgi:carboxyl-terminal processing protease